MRHCAWATLFWLWRAVCKSVLDLTSSRFELNTNQTKSQQLNTNGCVSWMIFADDKYFLLYFYFNLKSCRHLYRLGLDSWSGQTKDYKNWCSQLTCLLYSNQKRQSVASTTCSGQVDRWQLDSKTERSLRCILAKATWSINAVCDITITDQLMSFKQKHEIYPEVPRSLCEWA